MKRLSIVGLLLLVTSCKTPIPGTTIGDGNLDVEKARELAGKAAAAGARVTEGTPYGNAFRTASNILTPAKTEEVDPATLWPGGVDWKYFEVDAAGNVLREVENEVRLLPVPRPAPGKVVIPAKASDNTSAPGFVAEPKTLPKILRYELLDGKVNGAIVQ